MKSKKEGKRKEKEKETENLRDKKKLDPGDKKVLANKRKCGI